MTGRAAALLATALVLAGCADLSDSLSGGPAHSLPDPILTPGVATSAGAADICRPGYAHSVRKVSAALRLQVYRAYGLDRPHTGWCAGSQGCELDHLISLELGGSNDSGNLWPEPYDGPWNAHTKDRLENELHRQVCAGRMALTEAQRAIAGNWIKAYQRIFDSTPMPLG